MTHEAVWRRSDGSGIERFRLEESAGGGPRLSGDIEATLAGTAYRIGYAIECAPSWETRHAVITIDAASGRARLELARESSGRWRRDGRVVPGFDDCVDVDLSITPSTNLLPIRRLALVVGASAAVTAAWVRFPELTLTRLDQRYTRIAERRYHYESRAGEFSTELEVDEHGLVRDYPPFWSRVESWPDRITGPASSKD